MHEHTAFSFHLEAIFVHIQTDHFVLSFSLCLSPVICFVGLMANLTFICNKIFYKFFLYVSICNFFVCIGCGWLGKSRIDVGIHLLSPQICCESDKRKKVSPIGFRWCVLRFYELQFDVFPFVYWFQALFLFWFFSLSFSLIRNALQFFFLYFNFFFRFYCPFVVSFLRCNASNTFSFVCFCRDLVPFFSVLFQRSSCIRMHFFQH